MVSIRPANGVNTRTVRSSSQTMRPVRRRAALLRSTVVSSLSTSSCGLFGAKLTFCPWTVGSGAGGGADSDLQPTIRNEATAVAAHKRLAIVVTGWLEGRSIERIAT